MIPYLRDPQHVIPSSAVKIIGLGGAGANMLERIALDGMEGAELLALNTDVRTLSACLAREKIQLGLNLTKGLGTGGDPELGQQAVLEAEEQVRAAIKGRRIVFLCAGLGGGTGSGAAPIVTRVAREEGAFVVVFATMPFAFEGRRRREQAETALNELAVLSNALVTFDNNRMGELVLAKQGIHEAFSAADHMICESIKAVIRLVVRPGLINVGLDDLMSALRTNRSRCLFGSGLANGKDRASRALRNALSSPLLDQGALLKEASTVLVHLSGGEDLTLFEIELLMQRLQKYVPEKAHVLFGAAIDPAMGDSLSITLISALPEDSLAMAPRESLSRAAAENSASLEPSQGFEAAPSPVAVIAEREEEPEVPAAREEEAPAVEPEPAPESIKEEPKIPVLSRFRRAVADVPAAALPLLFEDEERPFAEPDPLPREVIDEDKPEVAKIEPFSIADDDDDEDDEEVEITASEDSHEQHVYGEADEPDPEPIEVDDTPHEVRHSGFIPVPKKRPSVSSPWAKPKRTEVFDDLPDDDIEAVAPSAKTPADPEPPKLKLGIKTSTSQSELSLDAAPRGRFEGENPNVFNGEDLDLPPFLRKKK